MTSTSLLPFFTLNICSVVCQYVVVCGRALMDFPLMLGSVARENGSRTFLVLQFCSVDLVVQWNMIHTRGVLRD